MSLMINRIAEEINFDVYQKNRSFKETKKYYGGEVRCVVIDAVELQIKIHPKDFVKMFHRKLLKEPCLVPPEESQKWIKNNVVGNYTQKDLDVLRLREVATLDMLASSGIIYHCESITEMQLLGLMTYAYFEFARNEFDPKTTEGVYTEILLGLLLFEHIFVILS
jgi:hypothetical protein